MGEKIKIGDTVEVHCRLLSSQKNIHKVIDIKNDYAIFDKNIGKIIGGD